MHGLESFQRMGFVHFDGLVNIVCGSSSQMGICLTFTLRVASKPAVRSSNDNFGDMTIYGILDSEQLRSIGVMHDSPCTAYRLQSCMLE